MAGYGREGVKAALLFVSLVSPAAYSAAQSASDKPFVDSTEAELRSAVPELSQAALNPDQAFLTPVLRAAAAELTGMLAAFVDVAAAEEIHEARFRAPGLYQADRREHFRYLMRAAPATAPLPVEESRTVAKPEPDSGFLVTTGFVGTLNHLLPQYQAQSRFRYLGRQRLEGEDCYLLAFAQLPESASLSAQFVLDGKERKAFLQGLVWIDVNTKRIRRVRTDLLPPVEGIAIKRFTTDVLFVPVRFEVTGTVLWLPAQVTLDASYSGKEYHNVYRYSDYRLSGLDESDVAEKEAHAGVVSGAPVLPEDAVEAEIRGVLLLRDKKYQEAASALHDALGLDPNRTGAHYTLGLARQQAGDAAGAEAQFRETVKREPEFASAHNSLGILLYTGGKVADAAAEFRIATRLDPKNSSVHFNLAESLQKLGDRTVALEEYRAAVELAPDDTAYKKRYDQAADAARNAAPTIRVDVRQVLVPVVITDKQGHYVTGLRKEDFEVFEDGVEQDITAFNVESVAAAPAEQSSAKPAAAPAAEPARMAAKPPRIRRTYLICIDTLHTDFGHFVWARKALEKFFGQEQAGDSQYALIALGRTAEVIQNITPDPALILRAIESRKFQFAITGTNVGSQRTELDSFKRELDEVRAACDAGEPMCRPGMKRVESEASGIAEQDRVLTISFLHQFGFVVEQLAAGNDRRTIVLISDGFPLVPGREAYGLLAAYFPEIREARLRAIDRMQDLFEPIVRIAAKSNVPIYTIDSRGLYTPPFFDASNSGGLGRMISEVSAR